MPKLPLAPERLAGDYIQFGYYCRVATAGLARWKKFENFSDELTLADGLLSRRRSCLFDVHGFRGAI
jgi:hypothetical protein